MYANQCIDALKEFKSSHDPNVNIDMIDHITQGIIDSHKFHFDSYDEIKNLVKNTLEQHFETVKEYIVLPYKKVWFDYDFTKDPKNICVNIIENLTNVGFYIEQREGMWCCFNFMKIDGKWRTGSCIFKFNPKTLDGKISVESFTQYFDNAISAADEEIKTALTIILRIYLGIIVVSCLFLSCKNVFLEKINPPQKLNKARLKRGKSVGYSYHVLKVRTINKDGKEVSGVSGEHNKIHYCRSHFKFYTKEKPLFGKYVGTWLWQSHLRGQNKNGFADKDYIVGK